MNSAIYLRVFLAITLGFGVLHVGSLIAFVHAPELFHFRAWEFVGEPGYREKDQPVRWHGEEAGDLSRGNFFLYQNTHVTTVTLDADGFRARRFDADTYPILIAGDSAIFGSGVSDNETLAWRLADLIGQPVFNAAGTLLSNALALPPLRRAEIIIDGWVERSITPNTLANNHIDPLAEFTPLARTELDHILDIDKVPPRRYSLPLKLFDDAKRLLNDIRTLARGGENEAYLFLRYTMEPGQLEETIAAIVERSETIRAIGKRYVFLPIPNKQTLYAPDVDPYTRDFIMTLVARLRAEDVEVIDLATPFLAEKDQGLFFPYDTHWNAKGTEIAARIIAREVFGLD